jgi:serine/threonine-protein kinase
MAQLDERTSTRGYEERKHAAVADTLADQSRAPRNEDLIETRDAGASTSPAPGPLAAGTATGVRTTVLPRAHGEELRLESRPRYEHLSALGEGGVGEVVLAQDHDIERKVAIKRLRTEVLGQASLLRFAEEIKTIGRLEHPSIVPIHDVGVDESGQHYFVMKYVQGETLETIIGKLAAGDPAYLQRFTYEARAAIALSILQAVRYAHAQGIIHRDLKPANIMVGPFGEVTVMDWGLAKAIGAREKQVDAERAEPVRDDDAVTDKRKLYRTECGAVIGTPMYMSPEQAAGRNDDLDARSDVYSLSALLHEFFGLEHYLHDKKTVTAVLGAVMNDEPSHGRLRAPLLRNGCPVELSYFVIKGMEHDPANRFQSLDEMTAALAAIRDGNITVSCHVTAFKWLGRGMLHAVDRHPLAYTIALVTTALSALGGIGFGVAKLVQLLAT